MNLIFLFLFVAVLLFSFSQFDQLVRVECAEHRDDWIQDGAPCGFFWRTPRSGSYAAQFARTRLGWRWLFHTPPWLQQASGLSLILWRYRISTFAVIAWLVFSLVWGVIHL